jgi:hypothetical protein
VRTIKFLDESVATVSNDRTFVETHWEGGVAITQYTDDRDTYNILSEAQAIELRDWLISLYPIG